MTEDEEREKACNGELCLECKSTDVECVGATPDGRAMNYAYDCKACGNQWEGY